MTSFGISEDEVYVTCVCGTLINETGMAQHIENCLKEDFIRNATVLKISKSIGYSKDPLKTRHICGTCIRCGHPMYKDEGTLITFYPSLPDSVVTCCTYSGKSAKQERMKESVCNTCKLPYDFHHNTPENRVVNCIDKIENGVSVVSEKRIKEKCRQQEVVISNFLESLANEDDLANSKDVPNHRHSVICDKILSGSTCRLFHVSLLLNDKNDDEDMSYSSYSLLLQILDTFPPGKPVDTQTDLPTTREFGAQVKVLGVYPEEVQKLLGTGKDDYDVPDFDPKAEAAYRSHLATLIPCKHCSRTFSPDRIQKHMSCCIERPRRRECVTPTGEEIPR